MPALHIRYEQRHHGLLGYAVPAPHLKPLPPRPSTNQTAADASSLPVVCHRSCAGEQ
uniref:Uncharacterized protein n=1 Tax=Amphilophus citrinellus TaxID=61819 RepID=A0A3Q0SU18_AMPCI